MNASQELVAQIRHHSRQLIRELGVVKGGYQDTDLSITQCHALFELSLHRTLTPKQLASHLLIDKSSASRTAKKLVEQKLAIQNRDPSDQRSKRLMLTRDGEQIVERAVELANSQVASAINLLDSEERDLVVQGLGLYAKALKQDRLQRDFRFRKITRKDNPHIADIIRKVMTEFRAVGAGYSIEDKEVDDIFGNYRDERSFYLVLVRENPKHDSGEQVVGGGGLGPLKGGGKSTCEIRKMFFLPEARGVGLGRVLIRRLLDEAKERGYRNCYLETLERMSQANELYQSCGFELLEGPMGNTGHCSCDRWYSRSL